MKMSEEDQCSKKNDLRLREIEQIKEGVIIREELMAS
jgi:hypothetical protein